MTPIDRYNRVVSYLSRLEVSDSPESRLARAVLLAAFHDMSVGNSYSEYDRSEVAVMAKCDAHSAKRWLLDHPAALWWCEVAELEWNVIRDCVRFLEEGDIALWARVRPMLVAA